MRTEQRPASLDIDPETLRALDGGLRRYFRRRAHPSEIDDLVQEVFVSLYARKADAPVDDLQRYLFTVAAHTLSRRARDRVGRASETLDIEEYGEAEGRSPERSLLGRERLDLVVQVISGLPSRTRQVFLLHRFEDRTYDGIARDLGISISAVEKHIMSALHALAAMGARS